MEASPLESKSSRSKKIILSSEDVFNCMDCMAACFKVAMKLRSLYFMILVEQFTLL